MKLQPRKYDDDDGRVICNMDVDGMHRDDKDTRRKAVTTRQEAHGEPLTRSEARRYTWYAIQAGLIVAVVFSASWVLFILFCTQVWFR